jgi:hypothetical protein
MRIINPFSSSLATCESCGYGIRVLSSGLPRARYVAASFRQPLRIYVNAIVHTPPCRPPWCTHPPTYYFIEVPCFLYTNIASLVSIVPPYSHGREGGQGEGRKARCSKEEGTCVPMLSPTQCHTLGRVDCREDALANHASSFQVAQLQKKKKAGGPKAKEKAAAPASKDDAQKASEKDTETADPEEKDADISKDGEDDITAAEQSQKAPDAPIGEDDLDPDEAAFNDAIKGAGTVNRDHDGAEGDLAVKSPSEEDDFPSNADSVTPRTSRHPGRQASISLQSKLRSTSFRDTAPGPASPSVGTLQRVEELERENRRLADEVSSHESRWRRTEEELEELRAEQATGANKQVSSLKAEIEQLKRTQRSDTSSKAPRRDSSGTALNTDDSSMVSLTKEVEAKDATIADMQLEISRLRSQLSSQNSDCATHGSQITSLQATLDSTETKLRTLEAELSDTKSSLSRASEKAVVDGTERTSRDTRIRELERQLASTTSSNDDTRRRAETLDTKIEALNKLHREAESRAATKLASSEALAREIPTLRARLASLEAENARLREKHKRHVSGGGADEGLDELEDEERKKLERRIRELEGQVFDLQRGVWRDKRTALQPELAGARTSQDGAGPTAALLGQEEGFDEVDLSGAGGSRRTSSFFGGGGGGPRHATASPASQQAKHSNFSQYISSGLNAFIAPQQGGAGAAAPSTTRPRNDSLLEDFDDDAFDEEAFARAQREEEMKKMVAHVREVKRGLSRWKGWRLDLVESRRAEGGGGVGVGLGEIFEV